MLAQSPRMETPSTYFTRRAGQERSNAAFATSADARRAHLELAVRLVKVATEPALWSVWSATRLPLSAIPGRMTAGASDLHNALAGAFPLPTSSSFEALLGAVDEADRLKAR